MFREESSVREEAADRYSNDCENSDNSIDYFFYLTDFGQAELAEKALAEQEENLLELG